MPCAAGVQLDKHRVKIKVYLCFRNAVCCRAGRHNAAVKSVLAGRVAACVVWWECRALLLNCCCLCGFFVCAWLVPRVSLAKEAVARAGDCAVKGLRDNLLVVDIERVRHSVDVALVQLLKELPPTHLCLCGCLPLLLWCLLLCKQTFFALSSLAPTSSSTAMNLVCVHVMYPYTLLSSFVSSKPKYPCLSLLAAVEQLPHTRLSVFQRVLFICICSKKARAKERWMKINKLLSSTTSRDVCTT